MKMIDTKDWVSKEIIERNRTEVINRYNKMNFLFSWGRGGTQISRPKGLTVYQTIINF